MVKDKSWIGDEEGNFDDLLSARVPSRGALRYSYVPRLHARMFGCQLVSSFTCKHWGVAYLLPAMWSPNPNEPTTVVQQRLGGLRAESASV